MRFSLPSLIEASSLYRTPVTYFQQREIGLLASAERFASVIVRRRHTRDWPEAEGMLLGRSYRFLSFIPAARAHHDRDHGEHHRHLHQHTDHRCKGRA